MKSKEIKKGIYWVGAIDWNVRNFHGYLTQRGTTYNAYLIIDEKVTLIDTVKPNLTDELISRISDIIDPSKIDYIICNHVEMDHSGAMPELMKINPNAMIVTCPSGEKGLEQHYHGNWNYHIVKSGDSISLGKRSLQFVTTPMVHWPDNMVSYMPEEKILFSNDAFGQHLASGARFDDEFPVDMIMIEARKYYANIVLPYDKPVNKALGAAAGLDIQMIAPSHGLIWRKNIGAIIENYNKWASNETIKKAVIVYDTMWNSTEKMAIAIQSAFEEKGYICPRYNLAYNHISDIMTELLTAEYVCVGSPTLNGNIMPSVAGFLTYMQGLAPKGRKAIAFGSYGWGDQSIPKISKFFEDAGLEIIASKKIKFVPTESDLLEIEESIKELI
ncbi:MAG: FprA family A-type flavoprotein [Saprospiraceae bacterium]|nr:FprA family A-type flavoprotein [Saprospiraceae bacterium]